MSYVSWVNKYKPKTLDEVIGNKLQIRELRKWMQNFVQGKKVNYTNSITISGDHGTGKTLVINLILQEFDFEPLIITTSNIKTFFNKTVNKKKIAKKGRISEEDNPLIQLLFGNTHIDKNNIVKMKKKAIIIADAEKITLKTESNILISLCKSNEKACTTPLIFVTNNQHSNLMTTIENITMKIDMYVPSDDELLVFINMICEKEGMQFKENSIKYNIIEFVKSDVRNLLMLLEDLYDLYGNKVITGKDCKDYVKTTRQKGQNNKLFPSTKMMLDDYLGIRKCQDIFQQNNMIVFPLMIYENFPTNIELRTYNNDEYYDACLSVLTTMSKSDIISASIHTEQNWQYQNLHGFVSCCEATFNLCKKPLKSRTYRIKYSGDTIDVYIQSISKKTIIELKKIFFEKSLDDLLMMRKYFDSLIRLNKLYALKSCLKKYEIDNEDIPDVLTKLLKIDKTSGTPTKIIGKTKKYLKLLEV